MLICFENAAPFEVHRLMLHIKFSHNNYVADANENEKKNKLGKCLKQNGNNQITTKVTTVNPHSSEWATAKRKGANSYAIYRKNFFEQNFLN